MTQLTTRQLDAIKQAHREALEIFFPFTAPNAIAAVEYAERRVHELLAVDTPCAVCGSFCMPPCKPAPKRQ